MDVDDDEEILTETLTTDKRILAILPKKLNGMQSILARQVLETNDSLVIAAPTGAGKTVIHELAIIRLILQQKKIKVLLICPSKALVQQRLADWQRKFGGQLGLKVVEVTGK
jgi:replicative superfamily II helicase